MQTRLDPGIPSFQELTRPTALPLATLHGAILDFIRDREDIVLCGAYAVNAYVPERTCKTIWRRASALPSACGTLDRTRACASTSC